MQRKYLMSCFALLSMILVPNFAHAIGFYIEPAITYESGDNELEWPSPLSNSTGTTKGLGVDLKMGIHFVDSFFLGVDGAYSNPKFENSANDYDANATSTTYAAVIGAQMPSVGLRIWGGYVFGGDLDPEESNGVDVKFEGAHGLKAGIGFKIFMVSINLEYMDLEYNESILEEAGPVSGTLDNDLKNKVGLVSLSMPFTF